MPMTMLMNVKELSLDLKNYRTVKQSSEPRAIRAMIAVNPEWFWSLTESLLRDGYLLTDNIIVLKSGNTKTKYTVKEGNRRIAALKLSLKFVKRDQFGVPAHILELMDSRSKEWKNENAKVPCAVYEPTDSDKVDRIVHTRSWQR